MIVKEIPSRVSAGVTQVTANETFICINLIGPDGARSTGLCWQNSDECAEIALALLDAVKDRDQ